MAAKFDATIDYKSQLNDYCQRNRVTAPVYITKKHPGNKFSALLICENRQIASLIFPTILEAENNIAFIFLCGLGENKDYPPPAIEPSTIEPPTNIEPSQEDDEKDAKNKIQEYCQKYGISFPEYNTSELPNNKFVSTAKCSGLEISSKAHYSKKRAEREAASDMLSVLMDNLPIIPEAKNKLQEFCQKLGITLPEYKTQQLPNGKFVTTVCCAGHEANSMEFISKKAAEKHAASLLLKRFTEDLAAADTLQKYKTQRLPNGHFATTMEFTSKKAADKYFGKPVIVEDPPGRQGDPPGRQGDPPGHQGDPPGHQGDPPGHQGDDPAVAPKESPTKPILLIDLESMQPVVPKQNKYDVEGFMSNYSANTQSANYKITTIDSAASDASLNLLTYMAGKMLFTVEPRQQFIIASSNKGVDVVIKMLRHDGYPVEHLRTAQDVEDLF